MGIEICEYLNRRVRRCFDSHRRQDDGSQFAHRHPAPQQAGGGGRGDDRRSFDPPDPDPRLREELAQEVRFILDRIPLPYRTILVLRDLEGFSSAEVASIVGRREATVRWRLAKARDQFRQHWERRQGSGDGRVSHVG